jgi:hypothetical protein
MKLLVLVPLLAGLLFCSSCASSGAFPAEWQSDEIAVGSERILWEVTVLSLEKHGFPVGTGVDPTSMEAASGWSNNLAPFRGQGYRERALVRYEPAGQGRYKVEVRVEHQNNMDISRPLDARYAKWEPAADDKAKAAVVLQRIKSWIGAEFEVGAEREPGSD